MKWQKGSITKQLSSLESTIYNTANFSIVFFNPHRNVSTTVENQHIRYNNCRWYKRHRKVADVVKRAAYKIPLKRVVGDQTVKNTRATASAQ